LLALQALDLYPNKICGNLALKGYFRTKGYQEMVSCIQHKQEKKTKRFTHSLYENVQMNSESVAGTYINIEDFKDGLSHQITC